MDVVRHDPAGLAVPYWSLLQEFSPRTDNSGGYGRPSPVVSATPLSIPGSNRYSAASPVVPTGIPLTVLVSVRLPSPPIEKIEMVWPPALRTYRN